MKKKSILFIFLFWIFQLNSQNQNYEHQKDSISILLKKYDKKYDTLLINQALVLAYKTKNDSIIREVNIDYGIESFFNNDLPHIKKSAYNLLNIYKKNKDSIALEKHYHYKALYFKKKFKTDSSFYYYHISKNISIALKDSLGVARKLLSMGIMQRLESDFLGSEISLIEGLQFIEPLNEVRFTAYLFNSLGLALLKLGKEKEARVYFQKYFDRYKLKSDGTVSDSSWLNFHLNVGLSFSQEGNNKKAITYFKKGLTFDSLEIKFPTTYQKLQDNLAISYFRTGYKEKAFECFKIALKSKEKHNFLYEQSVSHTLLAIHYFIEKNNKKGFFHSKKGLKLAKKTKNNERILENLKILAKFTKGEKGKQYLQEYIKLSDSLNYKERNIKNQFAKIRYETEKKDKENAGLKEENTQKQLLLEREKQQKTIGWFIAGISILVIGFGVSIASSRRKKILFNAKMQQIEAREKERQQIAKSLHDEVAGDIRMLHLKLAKTNQTEEAKSLDVIKENVRNLSHQLSSESFDKVSFKDQIINLISDFFEIDFRIKAEKIDTVDWQNINNAIKRTLFLTIRESIQNAKKHAAAKNVVLSFSETKNAVFLTISDNGKGFNVDAKKTGIGLKNMKERIEEINGVFSIKSELEKGTNIDIEIPKHGK